MASPLEPGEAVRALDALVAEHVAAVFAAALASPPGGGHAWDAVFAHYGLAPEPPHARLEEARRLGLTAGATPTEVRRALDVMAARALTELRRVASPSDARARQLEARLSTLPADEARRYEAEVPKRAPRAAGVASVFARALETSKQVPWAQPIDSTSVLTCPTCGAPQERSLDFRCRHCGGKIAG